MEPLRTTQLLMLSDHTAAVHRAGLGQAIPGADWAQAIFRLQTAAGLGLMLLLKADGHVQVDLCLLLPVIRHVQTQKADVIKT